MKKKKKTLIDYTGLLSSIPGEGFEQLIRQIGKRMNLSPRWSGRGPDDGYDLLFTEILTGCLSKDKITWLVSCKDNAESGKSVCESDLPNPSIKDKLIQHNANGFLLATTTTVSAGAKKLLDSLDNNDGDIRTLVWDSSEITNILLIRNNYDLIQQFLPESYKQLKGITTLDGAILEHRDEIPEEVLSDVMHLLRPFTESYPKGTEIWPYDTESAKAIDSIIKSLLIDENTDAAVEATERIEYDAFIALVNELYGGKYNSNCYEYLYAISTTHHEADIRFNAAQYIFDNYEPNNQERMEINTRLDNAALKELYLGEIASFVFEELIANTPDYDDLHNALDIISSNTKIESISIGDVLINGSPERERVYFSGNMEVDVTLEFDKEEMGSRGFPGTFNGYFDQNGMYLEGASVDTSSFY